MARDLRACLRLLGQEAFNCKSCTAVLPAYHHHTHLHTSIQPLQVLQEGLATAVGLGSNEPSSAAADLDELRRQQGLPPLPGWQRRRAERACQALFPDRRRMEQRLQEAAAAAVVLRNAAEVQQNSALLLDPPVMRCWTWALDAARELVQQQIGEARGSSGEAAAGSSKAASGGGTSGEANAGAGTGEPVDGDGSSGGGAGGGSGGVVVGTGGTAADICTTLLQAFFECGMLLLRSLLILMRPSWQYAAAAAGGAALPPPIVSLATLAVTAVATAYQPNTNILLSMTGAPNGGRPGATLMQVVADLLICPFEVFRCGVHAGAPVTGHAPQATERAVGAALQTAACRRHSSCSAALHLLRHPACSSACLLAAVVCLLAGLLPSGPLPVAV